MATLVSILFLVFIFFICGFFVSYIPFAFLLTGPYIITGPLIYLALLLWLIGGLMILWSFWDLLKTIWDSRTPIPFDSSSKRLVVTGLYKHIRNPIYAGVWFMLIANFLGFGYWSLLIYATLVLIALQIFWRWASGSD
jgi:protein-S-isoprenylcysteine O-methyltransferase Ste14